jgi:SAM-dependent methyltransferase
MPEASTYKYGCASDPGEEAARLRDQASVLGVAELEALTALGLPSRGTAVDVGCGPGFFASRLVERHPELRFIGVDVSDEALREAARTLTPLRGDVRRLPLRSDACDFTYARVVLKHVPHAEHAIAEMVRITKPGGLVVVEETDHASVIVYPELDGFDEVLRTRHDAMLRLGADPRIARRLPHLFRTAGLERIAIRVLPISTADIGVANFASIVLGGVANAVDAGLMQNDLMRSWNARVHDWCKRPDAFGWFSVLFVAGTKPAARIEDIRAP